MKKGVLTAEVNKHIVQGGGALEEVGVQLAERLDFLGGAVDPDAQQADGDKVLGLVWEEGCPDSGATSVASRDETALAGAAIVKGDGDSPVGVGGGGFDGFAPLGSSSQQTKFPCL